MVNGPKIRNICGQAFGVNTIASGINIAVVRKACSLSQFTFGHEIAHLFGCRHNREKDADATTNAHGFMMQPPANSGFRTIMG
jgi:hypothetical protein